MKFAQRLSLALTIPAIFALAACQKEQQPASQADPDAKPGLSASGGALVLPAVKGNPGAAYFALVNSGNKPATLAAVSIAGADKAEMHETKGGTMTPVTAIEVKPGETVTFERGGLHVMAFGLAPTVSAGGVAEMTLTFADGDKLSTPLKVEARGGGDAMTGMDNGTDHGGGMH